MLVFGINFTATKHWVKMKRLSGKRRGTQFRSNCTSITERTSIDSNVTVPFLKEFVLECVEGKYWWPWLWITFVKQLLKDVHDFIAKWLVIFDLKTREQWPFKPPQYSYHVLQARIRCNFTWPERLIRDIYVFNIIFAFECKDTSINLCYTLRFTRSRCRF